MTVARTWWLATALILGAGPALAQSMGSHGALAEPTAGARETDIDVGLVTTYETNVARSSAEVAAQRRIKPHDVNFRPTLNALISRPIGRETIFLSGAFGYDEYIRNHSLNSENIQFNAGALGRFAICQASLIGSYARQQRNLADLALAAPGGGPVSAGRDVVQDANVAFSTVCGRSTGFAPTISVSHAWSNNSLRALNTIDSESTNVSGGIAYRNAVLGSLTTFGQYSHTVYPNRPIPPGLGQPGRLYTFDTFGGGVTYSRAIGSRLAGSASLSYTDLQSSAGTGGFSGFTYAVDLDYRVTPRIDATVRFERATQPTNRLNSTFEVSELYLAQLNYKMGPRIIWSAGYSHSHNRYGGIVLLPVVNDLTQETTDSEFGTVQFQVNRRISTGIGLTHLSRAANFPGLSYSDYLASFNIRVKLR